MINGLLTSTLWYLATNIHFPSWAIHELEEIIYKFLWNDKKPLLNRDILALPLTEGGLNIPRIADKLQALRITTLKRLLTHGKAHWKFLTSHFLRLSHMPTGKHTLALAYTAQHIDRHIPLFHKDLLTSRLHHTKNHIRTHPPITFPDIMQEPLFLNPFITTNSATLYYLDWIKAGTITIQDLCYAVIPGFMPPLAIHELLTQTDENSTRTLQHTTQELNRIEQAIPAQWIRLICQPSAPQVPTLQPIFAIPPTVPNEQPRPLDNYQTKHFYQHTLQRHHTPLPALDHWQQTFFPSLTFNTTFWKTRYPKLTTNKQGDVNWKIAHRILPTALSLYRSTVYHTPNCHHCQVTENIEHIFLHCRSTQTLWTNVQQYINKMTHNTLRLTEELKLFGLPQNNTTVHDPDTQRLLNWTLTTARCAIHKSAVDYRTKQITSLPENLFSASVKTHLQSLHKYYKMQNKEADFASTWCIGSALATVRDTKIFFTYKKTTNRHQSTIYNMYGIG